jgi:hypothetical protein
VVNIINEDIDEENKDYGSSSSEIIARYMVEKIISYTITDSNKKEIDKHIGNHCFFFLSKMLSQMIQMESITFDREDYKLDLNSIKENELIFYDGIYHGINDWTATIEPVNLQIFCNIFK